tara:strand:+ start:1552 stop:2430 length:879 start_codon:yes stop_codon:yes gene_type:complete
MNRISKSSPDYNIINFVDIENCKTYSDKQLETNWKGLVKLNVDKNTRSFAGNKIIYHYMMPHLLRVYRDTKNYELLVDIFADPTKKKKWIDQTIKINRRKKLDYIEPVDIFECYRLCRGSIQFFKPATTKYLCSKFGATKMLDPTAGWGGRLLGARSLGIEYTGIDTNVNLKPQYDKMIEKYGGNMIYDSCLNVDFSQIDYDFVLTSPPYMNLEKYECMELFSSNENYYREFLIPLIEKCKKYIKNNGVVCINISDYMYTDYLKYGGNKCNAILPLKQQMGGKKCKEFIYIW